MSELIRFKNLSFDQAGKRIESLDEPRFRTRQVLGWTYLKRVESFDEMRNVSKRTRAKLKQHFTVEKLRCESRLVSAAGDAVKFGFRLVESDDLIESVLLIDRKRRTACLSSQLGCGLGCAFCATGAMGFVRNLAQDEVIGQLIGINDYLAEVGDKPITHVVFMGMGEALSNFEVFQSCCEIITAEVGFRLAPRRITVSTAGVVPSIDRLIREGPKVNLAISLNTYSDERRNAIMPINRAYPVAEVITAGRRFVSATGRRLTFEYVVVAGQTDTPEAADALERLLRGVICRVNCIPLNPTVADLGVAPPYEQVLRFVQMLHERGIIASARRSRGRDIDGACGQLATRARRTPRE